MESGNVAVSHECPAAIAVYRPGNPQAGGWKTTYNTQTQPGVPARSGVWYTPGHSSGHRSGQSSENRSSAALRPIESTISSAANVMSSAPVQGCVARRVLGRRFRSTASIFFPLSKMCTRKLQFKLPSLRTIVVGLAASFVRRLKLGWRLALQDPTPAWKKKGVMHVPSGWTDLTLIVSVFTLALLNWF